MIDSSRIVRTLLLAMFLATNIFNSLYTHEEENLNLQTTADYIIVGSGAAGAVNW